MDLFKEDGRFEPLFAPDADLSVLHGLSSPLSYPEMLQRLTVESEWRQESVRIYGKVMPQPRLVAWYGDSGQVYKYSGIRLVALPWTKLLSELRETIERITTAEFNSVFMNLYRDHNDAMGFHSDDEKELGPDPTIASVSFGATRAFIMKHKTRDDLSSLRIPLESGSVLLMRGKTQRFWKHGILKERRPCGPRVNLTFRRILHHASDRLSR